MLGKVGGGSSIEFMVLESPRIFDIGAPYSEKTWRVDEKTIKRTIKI